MSTTTTAPMADCSQISRLTVASMSDIGVATIDVPNRLLRLITRHWGGPCGSTDPTVTGPALSPVSRSRSGGAWSNWL